jgi:long-subunit fatty acid transport protein
MSRVPLALALMTGALVARPARAGGYDTPLLHSARHQAMGGTAIGYVDDASSTLHNPGGLGRVEGWNLFLGLSLLRARITTSPGSPDLEQPDGTFPSRTSEPAVAPLFLAAAAHRVTGPVTVGLAVYPVAAASGEYAGTNLIGNATIDKTRLVFIEASPAVGIRLREDLSLGLGYRATFVTLDRVKGDAANPREFDFSVKGLDFAGLRAGLQWQATDNVGLGLVYRHRIAPTLRADRAFAYSELTDAETSLVLPSKLGAGASGRWERLRLALDLEYGFYSQNRQTTLRGFNPALNKIEQVTNYFEWQNAVTVRVGGEYAFGDDGRIAARAGYIFDGKVSNKAYPSAFGTPPAPSHAVTAGAGYRGGPWQVNFALAYRFAATEVMPADVAGAASCATCSKPGPDYSLRMLGVYVDFSTTFDVVK